MTHELDCNLLHFDVESSQQKLQLHIEDSGLSKFALIRNEDQVCLDSQIHGSEKE